VGVGDIRKAVQERIVGEEHEKTGAILNNMAGACINLGQVDRAEQLYRKAKDHFELAGDKANTGGFDR
jgi:hypothetical protein